MPVDFTANSSNGNSNALDTLQNTLKLNFEPDLHKNPFNISSGVLGASSYNSFIDNTNIATNSKFTDNSSSNFVGELSKPWDDTFIYANQGVTFNGAPTLSSLPGALTIGANGTVSITDKLTGIQYSRASELLPVNVPYDELLSSGLSQVPSRQELVFNPSLKPLNTATDVTDAFKSNDKELSIVNVVGGGLNLPSSSLLRNTIITVENGDINFNGSFHELDNVTLIVKNGNINLSGIKSANLSVFASGSISFNQTATFSGENLLATKNGSVIFSGKTVTEKPSDSINVFANGNITINNELDARTDFLASGSFTVNGASKIVGSIKTQGDIIFNAPVQIFANNVIDSNQPAILLIDSGVAANNPYLDYRRLVLGRDYVDNDNNPLLSQGEGSEHGTHLAGIITGINNKAPTYIERAIGSGKWAEGLINSIDAAKQLGQKNIVVNLALDLTQINNADGTVTTRYEFTPDERIALEYAHQQEVVIVVAAGNDGGVMSALGQSSQEFDNIFTVGAADGLLRADYSSYGHGLNILAPGGTIENPILSTVGDGLGTMAGTSVATSYVTGAASRIWGENPNLSYRQVIEILESSATDLAEPGWDMETGSGLLNIEAAVAVAKNTTPQAYIVAPVEQVRDWSGEGEVIAAERAVNRAYTIRPGDTLWDIAATYLGSPYRWTEIKKSNGSRFTEDEARRIQPNQTVYLPLSSNTTNNGGSNLGGSLNTNLGQILNVVPSSIRSYAQNSIPLIIAEAQRSGITDPAQIAYILATAQQESLLGKFMYELASGDAYEGRRDLGNTQPGDGRRYKGRGFVQITGRNNYANWSRRLGIDLINNPDLAADPVIAAKILVQGMRDGSFTGVGLGKYISGGRQDFYNARRIVNGLDKASYIATLATNFWSILRSNVITNTPASNLPTTDYRNYYVRPGDTPSGIALREMGSAARWRDILKQDNNPLSDWDTRNLQVGQLLRLPFGYQSGTGKPVIPSLPSPNPNGASGSTIGIPVNLNSSFYTKNNPFWLSGYGGPNCTWYANGRLKELGYRASALDKMLGNAYQWDDQARKAGITVTNEAQVGAIAVWEPNRGGAGRLGHVAVVEQINPDGSLLISESNWLGKMYNTRTISGNKLPDHFVIVPRDSVPGNPGTGNSGGGSNNGSNNSGTNIPQDWAGNSQSQARVLGTLEDKQTYKYKDWVGNADTNDYYKFNLPWRSGLLINLNGLSNNAQVQLIKENGEIVESIPLHGPGFPGAIIDKYLDAGNYYIRVFPKTSSNNTNYDLNISVKYTWGSIGYTQENQERRAGIELINGTANIGNKKTWVVTHGWNNSPSTVALLASAIDGYENGDQVFALDWSQAADTGLQFDDAASWITTVGKFAAEKLSGWGISSNNINLVGHSFGSYVSYEISKGLGGISKLIALDPGAQTLGKYDDWSVDFKKYSDWSWGFYGSTLGSADRANTADESFRIEFPIRPSIPGYNAHGDVVDVFTQMLEKNNRGQAGEVSKLFALNRINGNDKPWQRHDGFEAILKPKEENSKWNPNFLEYYNGSWWDWPDKWEV